jgi:hypothetical protein
MFSSSLSQTVPLLQKTPEMTPATDKSISDRHGLSMACVNQTGKALGERNGMAGERHERHVERELALC